VSPTHRVRPSRRALRVLAATTITTIIAGGLALLSPLTASAMADLPVSGLYATVNGDSTIYSVDRATGAATPFITSPGNVTGLNQLGVSGDGGRVFFTNGSTIFQWTASTEKFTTIPRPSSPTVATQMGGVDPKTGRFYFGGLDTNTNLFTFLYYDPATGLVASKAVSVKPTTTPPGGAGDLAFDRQGNMYFISSGTKSAQVYRVNAADLGSDSTKATPVGPAIGTSVNLTSLAFGDDGYIYISGSGANTYMQVDPVTGAVSPAKSIRSGTTALNVYDLGSRALPSTGQSQGGFDEGRAKPSDELTTTISGGGIPTPVSGTTTPGTDTVTVGPIILLPGKTYTVDQTPGNSTTDPNAYDTTYTCTDLVSGTTVAQGTGTTATFTVPAGGGDVQCVFSNPPKPTVTNTSSTGNTAGQPVTVDPLQGSVGTIDETTVTLTPNTPGSTVSNGGKQLTVPGEGTWTVDPQSGTVTFTPASGATGNPTPVTYTVADTHGTQTSGQIAVTYKGNAQPDSATTTQGAAVTIDVLANDQGSTVASSVVFPTTGQPKGAQVSTDGRQVTIPGQGTSTIDRTTGKVTFTPDPSFRGTASPVSYRVADADGATSTATITVRVDAVGPTVTNETATTQQNTPTTVDVVRDAAPGVQGGSAVDPTKVTFPSTGQPAGATTSTDGRQLTVPGQGTYAADPTTGKITFAPAQGSTGTTTPVTYQVGDTGGATGTGTLTITVTAVAPTAKDDTVTLAQGDSTTVDVLRNDTAGNTATPLDPTSVTFTGSTTGTGASTGTGTGASTGTGTAVSTGTGTGTGASTVSTDGKQLTVPGEGTYVIDPKTGKVTFTPEPTFRGTTTPVPYRVADVDGHPATATITATVTPVGPAAQDDTATTEQNTPVSIDVLGNDVPGVVKGTPIDPTSVVFPTAGQPVGATVSADGRTLTVPAEGTYVVDPSTGSVTFTPAPGSVGTTTPVTYRVADTGKATATATIAVTVTSVSPTAHDDWATTPSGTTVTMSVLGNDDAGNVATPIMRTRVLLLDASRASVSRIAVPRVGTWSVDAVDGAVSFAPAAGFSGPTSGNYRIQDVDGHTSDAVMTVTVGTPPTAADDHRAGEPGTGINVDVLGNDKAGTTPLDPSSVRLVDPSTGTLVGTLTVPSEGTFTVRPTGTVTFTPVAGYVGTATVDYSVADQDGSRATATLAVTFAAVPGLAQNPAPGGGVVVTMPSGDRLAFTGSDVLWPGLVASFVLMAIGIGMVLLHRRRTATAR